jgi:taurine dioxygenase
MWANMALAYERLPENIRTRIADLRAKHSIEHSFGGSMPAEERAKLSATYPMAEHPLYALIPRQAKGPVRQPGFTTHFANFHNHEDVRFGQDFTIEANNLMNYLIRQAEILNIRFASVGGQIRSPFGITAQHSITQFMISIPRSAG